MQLVVVTADLRFRLTTLQAPALAYVEVCGQGVPTAARWAQLDAAELRLLARALERAAIELEGGRQTE
jgi:hypothetical protein